MIYLGIFVFFITALAILEGGRRFWLYLHRQQGRRPMAVYSDRWNTTRA